MRPIESMVYVTFCVSLEGVKHKNFSLISYKFFCEHGYKIGAASFVNSYFSDAPILDGRVFDRNYGLIEGVQTIIA